MNEPSVFEHKGNHMPIDNIHTYKSLANPENTFEVEHREVHNIYGYGQHKATYNGMVRRNKDQNVRPHVLSRSFYAGSQKWTTIWTGDTAATWEHLKVSVPMLLSLSLCGISNAGGDVGGFIGDPEPELAIRWYQIGQFMPFFRAHSETTTPRREPWLYEEKYMNIIKETIKERYRLLPYWYTVFEEHCRTLEPVLRPIWYHLEEVSDADIMKEQERFMLGDAILVVPILEAKKSTIKNCTKGLEGRWYDYYTKKEVFGDEEMNVGLERVGVFVKGGEIIPSFDIRTYVKSSKDAKESNINLYVALDEQGAAKGKLYVDDGESFNYKKGEYVRNIRVQGEHFNLERS
jgi:alpha-glucosidase (family GH31 glycosyl hydrolase)